MNLKLLTGVILVLGCAGFLLMTDGGGADSSDGAVVASGTCGTNLNWEYDDSTHVLKISGSGDTLNNYTATTTANNAPWKDYVNEIVSVVFDTPNCKTIGNSAFYRCIALTNVILPPNTTTINNGAFYYCPLLTDVEFPSTLTTLGTRAFAHTGVVNVVLPDGLIDIGWSTFEGCDNLISANIPANVTTVGTYTFSECPNLTSLTYSATNLEGVYENTVNQTPNLTVLTISENVKVIPYNLLNGVTSLKVINFNATNCGDVDTYARFKNTQVNTLNIGDGVEYIPANLARAIRTTVTDVNMGTSVQTVGANAFAGCTGITSIFVPSTMQSISDGAFTGCTGLTEILNLSDLDIVAGADTYGGIAKYATSVSDHIDSTAMVQQKEFVDRHTEYRDDATSVILRTLPVLIVVGIMLATLGMLRLRRDEL